MSRQAAFATHRAIFSIVSQSTKQPSLQGLAGRARCLKPDPRVLLAPRALFHTTPRRQGAPLVPLFVAVLKSAGTMQVVRTVGRVALTIFPVIWFKNAIHKKKIRIAEKTGAPYTEEQIAAVLRANKRRTLAFHFVLFIPVFLFWATMVASIERTPLTGRLRFILLSPDEEDAIQAQLAGDGWYHAVGEVLAAEGAPPQYIYPGDWRYQWVYDTLRKLEATLPLLAKERDLMPETWLHREPDAEMGPLPPPSEYPLLARPRAIEYLRWVCNSMEAMCEGKKKPIAQVPHAAMGPPYSLVIVDNPDAANAFSYGFGADGAGGIVLYSGFLDQVLARSSPQPPESPTPRGPQSWWSSIVGTFVPAPRVPKPPHPIPTDDQTLELAILLAHELSHLILSHHLETLSSGTVIIPGVVSLATDVVRVILFPITMLLGPFVNDLIAQLGLIGTGELVKIGEWCTSMKQEVEADVVSARLLAHAGFDARQAVTFWQNRKVSPESGSECSLHAAQQASENDEMPLEKRLMGEGHPVSDVRISKLREELARWETERQAALRRREDDLVRATVMAGGR